MGLRRLFILLIAAAFVFNGAAMRAGAGTAAPVSVAHANQHTDKAAGHGDHAAHGEQSTHHAGHNAGADATTVIQGPVHGYADGCLEYCGMCSVVSAAAATVTPVRISYAAAAFSLGRRSLVGHPVALDPDIPKSIV